MGRSSRATRACGGQDPFFYDVKFVDAQTGWIVGEFGNIYHTTDGGQTWKEQQEPLMAGTEFFDSLDLPTFFGVDFVDVRTASPSG